jgi:hypothetical protein
MLGTGEIAGKGLSHQKLPLEENFARHSSDTDIAPERNEKQF